MEFRLSYHQGRGDRQTGGLTRWPDAGGFTLIEILVVILIIGVVLSLVVLTVKRGDDQVEVEAQRLAALIDLAGQQAILGGRELAMEFGEEGYQFVILDGESWIVLEDDDVLRARPFPSGVKVKVTMEGEDIQLGEQEENLYLRIYLLSSGERSPFQIELTSLDAKERYQVSGGMLGKLKVQRVPAS